MGRYTHLRREDLAGALDVLPDVSSTRQVAMMTGTDGASVGDKNSVSPPLSPHGDFQRPQAPFDDSQNKDNMNSESPDIIEKNADFPGNLAFNGSIAQRLEQGSHKPLVPGSNPGAPIPPTPANSRGAGFPCFFE